MHIETITRQGKLFAVLPMSELKKLVADAEMLADVKAYDATKARLARGEEELIPFELIEKRLRGKNPVKLWRQYRELTQEKLAKASGVSRVMIAAIEAGSKKGGVATLKKLAVALGVSMEQILI